MQFVNLISSSRDFQVAVFGSYRMPWIISFQFSMAIKANRNKISKVIVRRISINMVNFDVRRACFATEATVARTP